MRFLSNVDHCRWSLVKKMAFVRTSSLNTQMLAHFPQQVSFLAGNFTQPVHKRLVSRSHTLLHMTFFISVSSLFYSMPPYSFAPYLFMQILTFLGLSSSFPRISTKSTVVTSHLHFFLEPSRDHLRSLSFPPINLSLSTTHFCFFPPDHF